MTLLSGILMNISKIVLILLVLNISCFASNEEQLIQNQPSFFRSYLKYVNPFYYWKKVKLTMIEQDIKTEIEKNISHLQEEIDSDKYDLRILEEKTLEELLQDKTLFKTKILQFSFKEHENEFVSNPDSFLTWKDIAIKDLKNSIATFEKMLANYRNNIIRDQHVLELEAQRDTLMQEIKSYE